MRAKSILVTFVFLTIILLSVAFCETKKIILIKSYAKATNLFDMNLSYYFSEDSWIIDEYTFYPFLSETKHKSKIAKYEREKHNTIFWEIDHEEKSYRVKVHKGDLLYHLWSIHDSDDNQSGKYLSTESKVEENNVEFKSSFSEARIGSKTLEALDLDTSYLVNGQRFYIKMKLIKSKDLFQFVEAEYSDLLAKYLKKYIKSNSKLVREDIPGKEEFDIVKSLLIRIDDKFEMEKVEFMDIRMINYSPSYFEVPAGYTVDNKSHR